MPTPNPEGSEGDASPRQSRPTVQTESPWAYRLAGPARAEAAVDLFGAGVDIAGRIPILACGKIGPARAKLVAGRNVELISANDVQSAIHMAARAIRLCLLRYDIDGGTALDVLAALFDGTRLRVPCIVLLSAEEWEHADACIAAGADDVVEVGDTEQVIFSLAKVLGLNFGRGPRATLETRASIEIEGQWIELDTIDLRPSGIAVRDMPEIEIGSRVRVKVDIFDNMVEVWALVARRWEKDGVQMAGLQFLGLTRLQRNWLKAAVAALRTPEPLGGAGASVLPRKATESAPAAPPPEPEHPALTSTAAAPGDDDDPVARSRWHLEQALLGEGDRDEHPRWIYGLIPELTPIERSGVLGVAVPEWVHQAVRVRLMLARFRDDCPVGPPPKPLTEACQQLFDVLAREAEDAADFDAGEQIGLIKGRVIQEFLDGNDEGPAAESAPPRLATPQILKKPAPFGPPAKKADASGPRAPARKKTVPPPAMQDTLLATAARRAMLPLLTALSMAIALALFSRIVLRDAPDPRVTHIGAADLATPILASMDVTTEWATAVVTSAWYAKTREEQVASLEKVRPRLNAWQLPVRYVVLHAQSGEPIALFDFDKKEILGLDQPLHLVMTRWRK